MEKIFLSMEMILDFIKYYRAEIWEKISKLSEYDKISSVPVRIHFP